jgi:hypothetical protein
MATERKQLQIRLPGPVYDVVARYAHREERSMGAQVAYVVRLWASQLPEPDCVSLEPPPA